MQLRAADVYRALTGDLLLAQSGSEDFLLLSGRFEAPPAIQATYVNATQLSEGEGDECQHPPSGRGCRRKRSGSRRAARPAAESSANGLTRHSRNTPVMHLCHYGNRYPWSRVDLNNGRSLGGLAAFAGAPSRSRQMTRSDADAITIDAVRWLLGSPSPSRHRRRRRLIAVTPRP